MDHNRILFPLLLLLRFLRISTQQLLVLIRVSGHCSCIDHRYYVLRKCLHRISRDCRQNCPSVHFCDLPFLCGEFFHIIICKSLWSSFGRRGGSSDGRVGIRLDSLRFCDQNKLHNLHGHHCGGFFLLPPLWNQFRLHNEWSLAYSVCYIWMYIFRNNPGVGHAVDS